MIHLETGKYGFFIWTAYGISAAMWVLLIVSTLLHARRWRRRAEALTRK
ncbi:heme exporter protein CcmD [Phenylobacterium sp.]|nr:heme exporter protein CcmD [Phenylobacterium sp.]HLZ74329.1 heme exporter protein CcmD [Phenylobacterium sp.]